MDFNQANWATITTGYLSSIKKTLSARSKSNSIIKAAKSFLKATSRTAGDTAFLSAEQETVTTFLYLIFKPLSNHHFLNPYQ